MISKLFGEKRHEDTPKGFYIELRELCKKYGVRIDGSEFGVHFTIEGSGLWHVEEFDENTTYVDDLEF